MKTTKDIFSIHTFMLSKKLNTTECDNIRNNLFNIAHNKGVRTYPQKNSIVSEAYQENGIIIYLKYKKDNVRYLQLKINPQRIITPGDFIHIFDYNEEHLQTVVEKINDILDDISASFIIDDMKLSRIDLCTNIRFDTNDVLKNQRVIKEYIRLFKQYKLPFHFKMDSFAKNEIDNAVEKDKHSIRILSNSYEVTIYDKSFQLKEEKLVENETPCETGILRFELCLYRSMINRLAKKNVIPSSLLDQITFFIKNSRKMIYAHLNFLYPECHYLSYKRQKYIINKSNIDIRVKDTMLTLAKLCKDYTDLDFAIQKMLRNKISEGRINRALDFFKQLTISPVPASEKLNEDLPSIYELFKIDN